MGLGPFEILLILGIVVLIFGVGKLSDVGGAVGKSIREFRKAAREPDELEQEAPSADGGNTAAAEAGAPHCRKCGAELGAQAKFCDECGTPAGAAVK
jgi:sec-independent protein translocase protein TatA